MMATESKRASIFYGYIVVLAGFFLMVIGFGTLYSYGVFFKPMLAELGWSKTVTSGAYSLGVWVYGSLSVIAGRFSDRFGPKVVVTICGLFLGLGYLLMSQVSAAWQLYLFYGLLVGTGMSGLWAPVLPVVARWFVRKRGLMSGIVVSGVGLGTIIMPLVASRLISSYDWRTAYVLIGIAALVIMVGAAQLLQPNPGRMGLRPYGEGEWSQGSLEPGSSGLTFRQVLHQRPYWMLFTIYLCYGFFLYAIIVHIVPHAMGLGISATRAANILAVIGSASFVGRIVMGGVADRIGNRRCLVISLVVMSVVLVWLLAAREMWMFYLFAAVFGLAYAGLSALETLIAAELFGLRSLSVIVGSLSLGFTFGGGIGPLVAGRIADLTDSYRLAFLICVMLGVVCLILSLLLKGAGGGRREVGG